MEEVRAYTRFFIDCPDCGDVVDLGDADPDGDEYDCEFCGAKVLIVGVQA